MADLRTEFIDAPLWQRFLLASLGIFLLFYLVYSTLFKNIWTDYRHSRKELREIKYRLKTAQLLLKDLPLLKEKEAALLARLGRQLPLEKQSTALFNALIKQSGLTIGLLKPQLAEASLYWQEQQYLLQLSGSLAQFQGFLQKLSASALAFKINSFKIDRVQADKYLISLNLDLYSLTGQQLKRWRQAGQAGLSLQGFWQKNGQTKAFLSNSLLSVGEKSGPYLLLKIQEKEQAVLVEDTRTHRKYTLKVLK